MLQQVATQTISARLFHELHPIIFPLYQHLTAELDAELQRRLIQVRTYDSLNASISVFERAINVDFIFDC
jgi:hypothetical protein